ncbi:Vacuolar protein sorting-associated protein like [Actinidia chinensis var. chinensis]|uniref:Vacuolar protein sorting-associated protein like n=1 Tax=Actinidia chinensis var. chinensis TaxID=1590841 RepID=A0A2R6PZI1_ACTCC|nr:Vacuolar protein sorting-associated protein like [Actinidia chinensis var. chinensis]
MKPRSAPLLKRRWSICLHCQNPIHHLIFLVFLSLRQLVRRLQGQDGEVAGEEVPATPKKKFQLLNQTIEALSNFQSPELTLRLYLQCAEAANDSYLLLTNFSLKHSCYMKKKLRIRKPK